ncbi:hypothetical protein [Amycolatopsis magusensis]|uniref:hypothetical protein n=1 Tax=Amycolatopsis magusensis TaxID=882444 RepID=UPI003797F836
MAASTNLTPEQRSLRARLAANAQWAREPNRAARMETLRKAAESRFERQVDPAGVLPPAERARRAASAQKAHMQSLALRSAKARKQKAKRQPSA